MVGGFGVAVTKNKDACAPKVMLVLTRRSCQFPMRRVGLCSGLTSHRRPVKGTVRVVVGRRRPRVGFSCAASPRRTFAGVSFMFTRVEIKLCTVHRLSRGVPLGCSIIKRRAYKPKKVTCKVESVTNILRVLSCVRGCSPST